MRHLYTKTIFEPWNVLLYILSKSSKTHQKATQICCKHRKMATYTVGWKTRCQQEWDDVTTVYSKLIHLSCHGIQMRVYSSLGGSFLILQFHATSAARLWWPYLNLIHTREHLTVHTTNVKSIKAQLSLHSWVLICGSVGAETIRVRNDKNARVIWRWKSLCVNPTWIQIRNSLDQKTNSSTLLSQAN